MYNIDQLMENELLRLFIYESNAIENKFDEIGDPMVQIYRNFLDYPEITVTALSAFVRAIVPKKGVLRDQFGMDVMVGKHVPPPGQPNIPAMLDEHLKTCFKRTPYENHLLYENLHPFMDGNGRSGRALWLREVYLQNDRTLPRLSFLHQFYYDTLENQEQR
jgi:hypothetical protein